MSLFELFTDYAKKQQTRYPNLEYRLIIYQDGEYRIEWSLQHANNWNYETSFLDEESCRIYLATRG